MLRSILRLLFAFLLLPAVLPGKVAAQKQIDQVIPDAEKRKVLRAKKLFNQYKIYEGERILKDLIKEHPYESYYYEALVQLQHQLLNMLPAARAEYEAMTPSEKMKAAAIQLSEEDSLDNEAGRGDSLLHDRIAAQVVEEWNGLDPGPRKAERSKKKPATVVNDEGPELTEAVMTIDSSLLADDSPPPPENDDEVIEKKKKEKQLQRKLKALADLAQIPVEGYQDDFIRNCRQATLMVEYADSASYYLRSYLVDTIPADGPVPDSVQEIFDSGMLALSERRSSDAKKEFDKAIQRYPDYYTAALMLGDACYLLGKDSLAVVSYIRAHLLKPGLPEPLEKLSQHYYSLGMYEEAAAYCIKALAVYPQAHYFQWLKRIVAKTAKNFNTQWTLRDVYPLSTAAGYFERTALETSPWWHYQAAESIVHDDYDSSGIVRPNAKAKKRYLEEYAWCRMLDSTDKKMFPFARAMRKAGFLDCYVLISCFHHDLYLQYADLVKREPEKVKDYFYMLINWEDKKFEKLRKEFFPEASKKSKK